MLLHIYYFCLYSGPTSRFASLPHSVAMASLPTAEFRESNVAAALDATAAQEIVEWSVIDDSGMRSTEAPQESFSEAIMAPSQSLRHFIELVPGDGGRHFADEVTIHPATKEWLFFKGHKEETGTWRRGSWDCTDTRVTLSFASRPGVAARTRSYYRNSYRCFAIIDHTTAEHCKFLLPQYL